MLVVEGVTVIVVDKEVIAVKGTVNVIVGAGGAGGIRVVTLNPAGVKAGAVVIAVEDTGTLAIRLNAVGKAGGAKETKGWKKGRLIEL